MTTTQPIAINTQVPGVPFTRLVTVELRKMFNTRSGFWLMMAIVIMAVLASLAVIAFVPDREITYEVFARSFGIPMALLLPIVAVLSVTSEWSQRTGLITFTLVPHRGSIVGAKAVASVLVGVVSTLIAFGIGAVGNVAGAALNGIDPVWNSSVLQLSLFVVLNVLGILVGFMLGVLIRNSAGAIVAYLAYAFVLPTIFGVLAALQEWFRDLQPWVDFQSSQGSLFNDGGPSVEEWAQMGTSGIIWFVIPMTIGLITVLRSEVK